MSRRAPDSLAIFRRHAGKRPGWGLRIPAAHPLGPAQDFFADADYGGEQSALVAIRTWRNTLFAQAGLSTQARTPRAKPAPQPRKTRSGILGLGFAIQRPNGPNSKVYLSWYVNATIQGLHRKTVFPVMTHGDREAFDLAIAFHRTHCARQISDEAINAAWQWHLSELAAAGISAPKPKA